MDCHLINLHQASFKSKEMDEISLALFQNLAAADLLVGTLREIPTLVSGIVRRWVFGRELCWCFGILYWIPQNVEFLTVALISLNRVCKLAFPMRRRIIFTSHSSPWTLCALLWAASAIIFGFYVFAKFPVQFDIYASSCTVYYDVTTTGMVQLVWLLSLFIYAFIPIFIIVISNLSILLIVAIYRFKHTGRAIPSKKSVITVSLVAWSFLFSLLPGTLVVVIPTITGTPVPKLISILGWECLTLNIWVNPCIYTIISVEFREFVVVRVMGVVRWVCRCKVKETFGSLTSPMSLGSKSSKLSTGLADSRDISDHAVNFS